MKESAELFPWRRTEIPRTSSCHAQKWVERVNRVDHFLAMARGRIKFDRALGASFFMPGSVPYNLVNLSQKRRRPFTLLYCKSLCRGKRFRSVLGVNPRGVFHRGT